MRYSRGSAPQPGCPILLRRHRATLSYDTLAILHIDLMAA